MSLPLPRYTQDPIQHDPVEALIAQRQAEHEAAQAAINAGTWLVPDPEDLRGIPCIARGVGGTSPGTDPYQETAQREHRLARNAA